MATCALFIDYENVFKSLRGQNLHVTHKQLAEVFKAEAARHGEAVCARAYAPWDIFPEAMSIFDRHDIKPEYVEGGRKDNADLVMSLAIQEFLRIPGRDADVFILVTGDGDFMHVIRILQQESKRVIMWGVEGSISSRLMYRVAEMVKIQDLLARHGVMPAQPAGEFTTRTGSDVTVHRDMAVKALILRSESVMLAKGWVQVPFLTLMHEMSMNTLFGEDSEQRRLLIVRCLEAGIMETKKQPNPKRPGTDTTFILLKKDNLTVTHTLQSVQQVVMHVRKALANMLGATWVAYSLLDKALSQDECMPQGIQGEVERRAWIDLCISEGILRLEKRDNPKNPDFPTSALYLVEDHPLVQQVIPGEDITPMLRRLILIMDHYLNRTGYGWMSMGLLRQQLGMNGQQEMERAIRVANETGIVVIRQQPNQFGSRPTTGAYLRQEQDMVREVLSARDGILTALVRIFQNRDIAPEEEVLNALEECPSFPADPELRDEWLYILSSHQILTRGQTAECYPAFILQKQHPVIVKRVPQVIPN